MYPLVMMMMMMKMMMQMVIIIKIMMIIRVTIMIIIMMMILVDDNNNNYDDNIDDDFIKNGPVSIKISISIMTCCHTLDPSRTHVPHLRPAAPPYPPHLYSDTDLIICIYMYVYM
jgi:hypothetical protein